MNTYWVYENIKEQTSFYNKLDVLLLLCSGVLWKKHHPTHHTTLYCDSLTKSFLDNINALGIWDKVELIQPNSEINRDIFWAASKVEQLKYINTPTVLIDHDFLVYKSLDNYLENTPLLNPAYILD